MKIESDILILGQGQCAREAAIHLARKGANVVWAVAAEEHGIETEPQGVHLMRLDRLASCTGQGGDFKVVLDTESRRVSCHVKCILVAAEAVRHPNFKTYGLQSSTRVRALSHMELIIAEEGVSNVFAPGERVLFLNSRQPDTHPVVAARMMRLCLKIQQLAGVQTFFVTGNLKVSTEDMERVFQEAKAAGTIFIRSIRHFPTLQPLPDGRVRMTYHDEVTRGNFYMTADGVIVDESLGVDPFLSQVADSLRLATDSDGFLQQDNVRRLSHETNRRGIFVAAGARSFFPQSAMIAEAEQAALKAWTYILSSSHPDSFLKTSPKVSTGAKIDQSACARCLTCYRLCPYAAIDMSPRMSIHPEACQACGLCRAGCPNRAIHIDDRQLNDMIGTLLEKKIEPGRQAAAEPNIVAFCCERSAAQSRRMALGMGHRLPAGMVFVEGLCGGTLSVHDVLRSFEAGADGVMVLTCHEGNCHSHRGTHYARKRVSEAAQCLSQAGVPSDRIHYSTLASNMMHAFVRRAEDFAKQIAAIGPFKER